VPSKRHAIKVGAVLVSALVLFFIPTLVRSVDVFSVPQGSRQDSQHRRGKKKRSVAKKSPGRYANFSHTTHVTTQKLACSSCHKFPTENWKQVRKGDATFPDVAEFPQHSACLDCHRKQFFARERPAPSICANCHVNVTPRDTARYLFPSLGDVTEPTAARKNFVTEFAVNFPHEKHLEVISAANRSLGPMQLAQLVAVSWKEQEKPAPVNCPVCHQTHDPQGSSSEEYGTKPPKNLGDAFWMKKGTFKTIPTSHTGCFTCHNAEAGIAPLSDDCQACHKLIAPVTDPKIDFDESLISAMGINDHVVVNAWSRRESSGAFRHEGGAHPDLACTNCHQPARMNTVDPQTLRVSVRSCGGAEGCHITATSDDGGILNYEIDQKKSNGTFVCTKCHLTYGKQTIPLDHAQAIPTPSPAKKPGDK